MFAGRKSKSVSFESRRKDIFPFSWFTQGAEGGREMEGISEDKKSNIRVLIAVGLLSMLLGVGGGAGLAGLSGAGGPLRLLQTAVAGEARSALAADGLPDFATLAKRISPVVVNISTTQLSDEMEGATQPFGEGDPFGELWHRFFGGQLPRGQLQRKSLGSGLIIDPDGYILTNDHVVENAEKIVVKLSDGREFEAKVVGEDPKTDVAVVKIGTNAKLPVALLGDSDRLEVGEWVMAIGNPFGLDNTVTKGIVSAKGRRIGAGPYDDFIQTDASINPGNSGGPLINLHGEVVGINTAIFSQTGSNIGIGFATPISLVKELLPQLKEKGKVVRGYLGVVIQKVTPEIAGPLGLDKSRGALVAEVSKDGPADRAGIKVGNVIVEYDDKEIKDSADLPIFVASTSVDKKVRLKVLRDGQEVTLTVTVGELKEEKALVSARESGKLGLTVQNVTPQLADSLGLDLVEGTVIVAVEPGSPADEAGLQRGDVVLEIDRKPIRDAGNYLKAIDETEKGKVILFLVRRGEGTMFLALKPSG
jgi:serine protease Do